MADKVYKEKKKNLIGHNQIQKEEKHIFMEQSKQRVGMSFGLVDSSRKKPGSFGGAEAVYAKDGGNRLTVPRPGLTLSEAVELGR